MGGERKPQDRQRPWPLRLQRILSGLSGTDVALPQGERKEEPVKADRIIRKPLLYYFPERLFPSPSEILVLAPAALCCQAQYESQVSHKWALLTERPTAADAKEEAHPDGPLFRQDFAHFAFSFPIKLSLNLASLFAC